MIITCPCGEKKFNVESDLIPSRGRLLKCGSCNETWFFNKNDHHASDVTEDIPITESYEEKNEPEISSEKYKEKNRKITNFSENKGSELIKYRGKSSLTISKTLSYIIVSLISFIGLIILLDTFKNPLSVFFPNIELFLYNLFETLRDLFLFAKDLK